MAEIVANRVGTFAQRSSLVQQMMTTQKRLYEAQTQIATEQKSQDYAGISFDSFRLVSIETERTMVQRFSQGNTIAQVRLETMNTSVEAVQTRLHDLRDEMLALGAGSIKSPLTNADLSALDDIQDFAFAALQDMTFYLNSRADGRYVFSGGRTNFEAVDLPYSNLAAFQEDYDGNVIYPETRDAHVANVKLTNDEHGGLTASPAAAPLTADAGAFDGHGGRHPSSSCPDRISSIRFAGQGSWADPPDDLAGGSDDIVTISPPLPNPLPADFSSQTLESVSYYNGDDLKFEHRVNERRTIELGINAKDPAFEKGIRAMGMLSQGNAVQLCRRHETSAS